MVSNELLRFLKYELLSPLTQIINKSIASGIFPSIWKIGKVCPVPKKGSSTSMSNFRPVCLSSNIGKVVEAVIRSKVTSEIDQRLPQNMFGFRKNKSTSDALVTLLDKIRIRRSNGKKVALLALDASAAFDTIPHQLCRDFHICRKRHFFKIEIITFLKSPNYALYFILIHVF